jgi:hypothetical protein
MPTKAQRIAGWVVTALVALAFAASAAGKFTGAAKEGVVPMGIPEALITTLGAIELACAALYALPLTSFLGAILLTGYAGGAVFAHLRAGVPSPAAAIILGVLAWVGYGLRHPGVIRAAFGRPSGSPAGG